MRAGRRGRPWGSSLPCCASAGKGGSSRPLLCRPSSPRTAPGRSAAPEKWRALRYGEASFRRLKWCCYGKTNDINSGRCGCDYYLRTRMNTKVFKWKNLWWGPAALLGPVDGEHVVCEHLPEGELVHRRLRLHLRESSLPHLQPGAVQLWCGHRGLASEHKT